MTSKFPSVPIKRLAACTLGKMLQSSDDGDDVLAPYLRAANVQPDGVLRIEDRKAMWFTQSELAQLTLLRGDVVVVEGGIGGFGRAAYLSEDLPTWGFQNSIIRLRPLARTDGRFLAYALLSARERGLIKAHCNIVSMPHFTVDKVAGFELPAPPPHEQRMIADFLDEQTLRIDTLIDKQTQLIATLRERRAAVIEARLSESEPVTSGQRLKHVTHDIRQGWSPQCLGWAADGRETWAVLKAGAANGGRFRPEENKELPAELEPRPATVVRRGDLVISRANTRDLVGSAAVVGDDYPKLMLCDKLYAFRLDLSRAVPDFVALKLGTRELRGRIEVAAGGASPSMQNISREDLAALPMDLPAVEVQTEVIRRIAHQTSRIDALIGKTEQHIVLANERRAAVITAAVGGQIDVRTAGRATQGVS